MDQTRRSLIIGAGLAAAAPQLVRAQSMVEIPWNMQAAQSWAIERFSEHPGCRMIFSDGHKYRWMNYPSLARGGDATSNRPPTAYAVAIEVCVTDAKGNRMINTIPVDGYALTENKNKTQAEAVARQRHQANKFLSRWDNF